MKRDEALGAVVRFWVWADSNTVDGVVDGVASHDVDAMLSCPGLCAALGMVGWLEIDNENERMTIPKFTRHNGKSAKKRALRNERQAKWRDGNVDVHVDTIVSTQASPEKRREDKTPLPRSGAFLRFWETWPSGSRKKSQGKCLEVWRKKGFDQAVDAICAHVETSKLSGDWQKGYVPTPLVYLNQRQWEGADLTSDPGTVTPLYRREGIM